MSEPAWQFEQSVECGAKRSFVWSYWTDVNNWERLEGKAVEWIKLKGPFAVGTTGVTKIPEQNPQYWKITNIDPARSATIEMPLDGAVFYNRITLETLSPNRTKITQRMSLAGEKAPELAEGMRIFEVNAPKGLSKLAEAIESAYEGT